MQLVYSTLAVVLLAVLGLAQDDYYEPPSRPISRPAPARLQSGYSAPSAPKPTPTAILKQINRHNEDGSYTYGYEGADGTFKIETKLPNGEVKGKYGYLDDTGKVRVVEYGANRYGFQPAGEGITVAPPTLVDDTTNKDGTINEYADQGQYYEQDAAPAPAPRPRPKAQPQFDFPPARFAPQPDRNAAPPRAQIPGAAPVEIDFGQPRNFAPRPQPSPVHSFAPAPRPAPRPAARPLSFQDPAPVEEDIQYAEPAPRPVARPASRPVPLRPAPSFRPAPAQPTSYAPRPGPVPQPGRGGVLDQLARDYALPQDSAAPLHDISFGYY